jgi:hypothetical protein
LGSGEKSGLLVDVRQHVPAELLALHRGQQLGPVGLIGVAVVEPRQPDLDAVEVVGVLVLAHDAVVQPELD